MIEWCSLVSSLATHNLSGDKSMKYIALTLTIVCQLSTCILNPAAVADPVAVADAPRFTVTDLGTLGGAQTEANAINDRGEIAGEADTSTGEFHAFLWRDGHIQDLGTLGGKRSVAEGINKKSQVVGEADHADGRGARFIWEKGKMRDMETTVDSAFAAVHNERGQFVVPDESGTITRHRHIGQMVNGKVRLSPSLTLLDTDLPIRAVALNDIGHAVGESFSIGDNGNYSPKPRAYLWTQTSLTDLGSLSGQEFLARRINNQDQVVGLAGVLVPGAKPYLSGALPEDMHAFLWERGSLYDLNALIPSEQGWVLWDALGLNNRGQIVGTGLHHGKQHAFLLTPINGRSDSGKSDNGRSEKP